MVSLHPPSFDSSSEDNHLHPHLKKDMRPYIIPSISSQIDNLGIEGTASRTSFWGYTPTQADKDLAKL
uniref:Uncharacterized protein n=1 Tax=Panagrolaimus sp. ES5 TaxID=591445 RepID=A0AC34GQ52_9BILA